MLKSSVLTGSESIHVRYADDNKIKTKLIRNSKRRAETISEDVKQLLAEKNFAGKKTAAMKLLKTQKNSAQNW